jgi:branched-chain amino acid transport system substrate-binding protein
LQILAVSGFTGSLQENAHAQMDGANAAIDNINEHGGLLGRQIKVTQLDDQSDPTRAVSLLTEYLAAHDKPDFVSPGIVSAEVLATGTILDRQRIIGISSAGPPSLVEDPESYYYAATTAFTVDNGAAVRYVAAKGGKSIALVVPNDVFGENTQAAVEPTAKELGIALHVYRFDSAAIDISSAFIAAKQAGDDYIYMDAVGTVVPRLFDGRIKAGAENVPTITGFGVATSNFADITTPELRKNVVHGMFPISGYIPPEDRSPALNDLIKRLPNIGTSKVPLHTYSIGYDSIMLWKAAVEQAGTVNSDAVKAALEHLKLSGAPANERPWISFERAFLPNDHTQSTSPDKFRFEAITGQKKDGMLILHDG